jgi:kumamolisin
MARAAIAGSAPDHTGYRREGAADPAMRVRVTIVLRPADSNAAADLLSGKYDSATRAASGASEGAMAAVEEFARENGLSIEESDPAARTIVVSGSANQMSRAFGVSLGQFVSPDGARHLSYEGSITLPTQIAEHVLAVLGLDTRPVARSRAPSNNG